MQRKLDYSAQTGVTDKYNEKVAPVSPHYKQIKY